MNKLLNIYHKYEEIINYLIIGVLTTLVNIVTKYLLLFTILNPKNSVELQIAIIISWIASIIFAYITNKLFVFKAHNKKILPEICSFVASRISTLLLEMFIMWFFITFLKLNNNLWVIIFTIISQGLVIILNYVLSKIFVFKKQ